ncbi:O-antigen ligase family protein [Mucilaginibacter sp. dw_454]|uniref:O-antigen ligase family protein n=1 Tax=Mucilaginibacter sp. dw_454 TaxID=2720079 RepID=UPI001BD604DB|nr:O-antigen ligase family protein [Mucilaginibacter sp. dw_454]
MKPIILGVLPYITLLLFFYHLLRDTNPSRAYVVFVLLFFPVIYSPDHVYSVFEIATYFFFFYSLRTDKRIFSKHTHRLTLYILGVMLIGTFLSDFIANSLLYIIRFLPIILYIHVLLYECIDDEKFLFRVIDLLKINLVVSLVFLMFQLALGLDFSLFITDNPNIAFESIRYPGIFQDPQKFAQFLSALSFITLIDSPSSPKFTRYKYLLFAFAIIGLFLTGGRAALLGLVGGIAFIALFSSPKVRAATLLGGATLFLAGLVLSSYLAIFNRGESLEKSYLVRYEIWQQAYKIVETYPIFGIGMGNYSKYAEFFLKDQFWLVDGQKVYFDQPESGYLKFLVELGFLGTFGVFAFIFGAIYNALKVFFIRVKDFYIIFLISAIITWLFGFYSVYSLGDERIIVLVATIVCILIAYSKRYDKGVVIIEQ